MQITTHNSLHRWTRNFVEWIAPEPDDESATWDHAQKVLENIKNKAEENGLVVVDAVISGSLPKGTGLRRHLKGNSSVEGQDIDLSFILEKEKDLLGNLKCLVPDFQSFAKLCYPDSEHPPLTKSSAPLKFIGKKLHYDLVPLFKSGNNDHQILVRTNGDEWKTSVLKHIEFTHSRVATSKDEWGIVKFSDMVRLFKWWRYEMQESSGVFGNEKGDHSIPSFLIDLLCAKAFDECGVKSTYPETLAMWFAYLENLAHNRDAVVFKDNYKTWEKDLNANWIVLDPVDKNNNVVGNYTKWNNRSIDELAKWLADGRDHVNRALRLADNGDESKAKAEFIKLFGSAYKNHTED
ncbi:MAG: CBASS oligonucleotide cyclase [Imperialibacter sp.]|uniref:CBASS oligonucleotide cyclase n=1 Tax=Imperialibacter sp. TaxID=2038411 RepID=UPI0032F04137